MERFALCVLVALAASPSAGAAEVLPPVSQRFSASQTEETPDFRRHVVTLLGRLGCNGRACHGSFQGQGGFRLSLFGYDFTADHEALAGGDAPRVNLDQPPTSLILQKPTLAIDHEGGERFKTKGWEYRLLSRWIESGAPQYQPDSAELLDLHITPTEIVFDRAGQTAQLNVVAEWADGTREDVTPLCRFRTNDESMATVSLSGQVTACGKGDTHVVAFYDNGTTAVPVLQPVSDRLGSQYPRVLTPTKVDELVVAKLRKLGIVPSVVCTDAEFLRRVSLDMTGTLPMPDEVESFLANRSPDKRARKIDELLERPTYAAWWTTRLCDWTGNSEQNLPVGGEQALRPDKSKQWYDWIYRRIADNVPYDQLVEGIVLATNRTPGQTDDEYFAEMSAYFRTKDPADFAARKTMPYFWSAGRETPPQALRFSYAFLGIRLECAECHKHPYDQWTKDDFEQFKAFFVGVHYTEAARARGADMRKTLGLTADQDSGDFKNLFARLAHEGTIVPWKEVVAPNPSRNKSRTASRKTVNGRVITPKLLGGEEVIAEQYDDPREPLMQWLRRPDNPYFARALVNRVWADYFGVGIVDPPDDMNLANPPSNEPLLAYLAHEFAVHGYDLKWLHREIANSRTYQLSWRPNETNELDERNFSRALVRRLPAEVAYDALLHATAASEPMHNMHHDLAVVRDRAIGVTSGLARFDGSYAVNLFGKPARAINCDCERSSEPSLLQTVYLRNDAEMLGMMDRNDGWLREVFPAKSKAATIDEETLIRNVYLRTVCRPPTDDELSIARESLSESTNTADGVRNLLWAMLNTKEFILNH